MVYLISCISCIIPYVVCRMSYTPLSAAGGAPSVTCIIIIDTLVLNIHTNNAYTYDTHTPLSAAGGGAEGAAAAGRTYDTY
jgi:hypothetical protein